MDVDAGDTLGLISPDVPKIAVDSPTPPQSHTLCRGDPTPHVSVTTRRGGLLGNGCEMLMAN